MPDLSPERVATWRAFLEAHAAVVRVLEAELAEAEDLPLPWYDVLVQLSEAPDERLRMQDLADAVLLSKSGVTRLVQRMQGAGLVDRVPCDDDRRGTWAVLTPAGLARLRQAAPTHVDGVRRHFCDHLDPAEEQVVRHALSRVARAAKVGADPDRGPLQEGG